MCRPGFDNYDGAMIKRTDLKQQAMGEELMIMDEAADKVHVLNPTSAFIWSCLDESPEADEIERKLRGKFQVPAGYDVSGLIGRALDQFRSKKLLVE